MDKIVATKKKIRGLEILIQRGSSDPKKKEQHQKILKGLQIMLKKYLSEEKESVKPDSKKTNDRGKEPVFIPSMVVSKWDEIPVIWRNADIPKPLKINYSDFSDKSELAKLLLPFCGKDELRPLITGIFYDEKNIVATNAHHLICIPNPTKIRGVKATKNSEKAGYSLGKEIEGRYPNYEAVIPVFGSKKDAKPHIYKVDLVKLKQYCQAAENYCDRETKQIVFKYDEGNIGFNAEFMLTTLDGLMKLGYSECFAFLTTPSRGIVFSPNKNYRVGEDLVALLMPVNIMDAGLGAEYIQSYTDISYRTTCYYDFTDNQIHNGDGSVADFKLDYGDQYPILTENEIGAYKILFSKAIPITENFIVENGVAYKTDLEHGLFIQTPHISDGTYMIIKDAVIKYSHDNEVNISMIEDYPRQKPEQMFYNQKIESKTFVSSIKVAQKFLGDGKINKANEAFDLDFDKNKLKLAATDGYGLYYKNNIPANGDDFKVLITSEKTKNIFNIFSDTESDWIDVKKTKDDDYASCVFEAGIYKLSIFSYGYSPINFKAVLDIETSKKVFLSSDFINLLSELKKIKTKKGNNILVGYKDGQLFSATVSTSFKENPNWKPYKKVLGIEITETKPTQNSGTCIVTMPLINTEGVEFGFNVNYLWRMVSCAKDYKKGVYLLTKKGFNSPFILTENQMK